MIKSGVNLGYEFLFDLIILHLKFLKTMIYTVYRYVFKPTEKSVRHDIVLITGSGKGTFQNLIKFVN